VIEGGAGRWSAPPFDIDLKEMKTADKKEADTARKEAGVKKALSD
jgi:hypothetical protein